MTGSTKSPEIIGNIIPSGNTGENGKKEILYNGYLYDVTNFISKHPGGNVIKFYTEPGEDASQAIQQFHYRSKNKVELMLKSFSKRLPDPVTDIDSPISNKRHQQISHDFNELFQELIKDGYFEPSIREVILRCMEPVIIFCVAFPMFINAEMFITKFFLSALVALHASRFGWIQHEAGHRSLTGNPKIDHFLQLMSTNVGIGTSSMWWNSQHNRHHAMPQRLHHDVDLAALPFMAFNAKAVSSDSKYIKFFMKYQGILYWTLDVCLGSLVLKFYVIPRSQWQKKAYLEMILTLPSLSILYSAGPIWYILLTYWFALFLSLNFALSHSHLDVTDKPTHWVEYSLTHTVNIKPSMFVDWWMGYLNYQIEHHLFPTMPQFRQRQIGHRVKALADKHGLPYRVYGYSEACKLAVGNLFKVAKELEG